jgi:hypothetical protein
MITTALSDAMNANSEAEYSASLKEAYNSAWSIVGTNAKVTGNGDPVWNAISHTAHALYRIRSAAEANDTVSFAEALEELEFGITSFEEVHSSSDFGELISALRDAQAQWKNQL